MLLFAFAFASLISATPITPVPRPHLYRRANLNNLDILVEDGDTLVRGVTTTSTGSPHPGDVTFIGDGSCHYGIGLSLVCSPNFCSVQTIVVSGVPLQASPDIDCSNVVSCSTTQTQSITVGSTKAINGGLSISGDVTKAIKATGSLGGSYSWTENATTGTSRTFTPNPGDKGHIIFVPYMLEVCGTYYTFFSNIYCEVLEYSPMSCAQTPFKLPSGEPSGVRSSFFELF
jgi:hypothetical protein